MQWFTPKLFPRLAPFLVLCLFPFAAQAAGYFELSGGAFYTKSTYSSTDYNWVRRYGATFGYHLTETSEIEFTFQDVTDRTVITGFEDTTFHDQIYGVDWNQALTPKGSAIQPYVKAGIGQLNRTATGEYAGGVSPPLEVDQVTGIAGVGLRIYLTRQCGLRGEVISYLTSGGISTWNQNISTTLGVSIYF
jgi:hypothetical protein